MKFELGQKVKVVADGEVGEVLSIHVDADGVRYTISSREVDLGLKKVIEGIKHCKEEELEAVVEAKEEEKAEEVASE